MFCMVGSACGVFMSLENHMLQQNREESLKKEPLKVNIVSFWLRGQESRRWVFAAEPSANMQVFSK